VVQFAAKRWAIKALPIDLGVQAPPVGIVTLRNRTLSPVVQLFIECAREVAKSIAGANLTQLNPRSGDGSIGPNNVGCGRRPRKIGVRGTSA
jgi:hypothetical protein